MTDININNLFNYCSDENIANDVYYYIKNELIGNSLFVIAVSNNKILSLSNEWLSLIKTYYPVGPMYTEIIDKYKYITNSNNQSNIVINNNDVIPFITSFSPGTVHGYAGIFSILIEYLQNYNEYKNYKIIVYNNSQKGILDIINHLCNTNIIDKNNIIYVDSNIIYKFNKMLIIPNKYHNTDESTAPIISNFIQKYFLINNFTPIYERILIIKSSGSQNLTNIGVVSEENINNFTLKNNLIFIEPIKYNEVDFINLLYNVKYLVLSWGTTFFKNYYYISDKCTTIIVLIIGNEFIKQYNETIQNNSLIKKFKNVIIDYRIVDEKLDFMLDDLS